MVVLSWRTPPIKLEIRKFVKLIHMLDFLKEKYRPFTAIAREAVKRGIIEHDEIDSFYRIFTIVVHAIGVFEGAFFPSDQTPTGKDRWEWRTSDDMTEQEFMNIINNYVSDHFKKPL